MAIARTGRSSLRPAAAAAGSWIAIVAATTLGDAAAAVRAEVRAAGLAKGNYRLVVQSYGKGSPLGPGRDARPIGSAQRAVTADELENGVHVSLLELRSLAESEDGARPVVMAWIESAGPDLAFDGRMARPSPGSTYGVAMRPPRNDVVQISLNRKRAG